MLRLEYSYSLYLDQIGEEAFAMICENLMRSPYASIVNNDEISLDNVPEEEFLQLLETGVSPCLDKAGVDVLISNTYVDSEAVQGLVLLGRKGAAIVDPGEMCGDPFGTLLHCAKTAAGTMAAEQLALKALGELRASASPYGPK